MNKPESRQLDKFYTRPEIVAQCLQKLNENLKTQAINSVDLWLEPSAGAGAFLDKLPAPRIGLDLAPEAAGIEQADFLKWCPSDPNLKIATVGNPPFGKVASKAVAFFNHAAKFSTVIAMVLPRTFEKAYIMRRLNRNFHRVSNTPLPKNAFTFMGKEYSVPCTFQVWVKSDTPREVPPVRTTHADFRVTDPASADLAFQRVGAKAGTIKTEVQGLPADSHIFFQATRISPAELERRLRALDFDHVKYLTAGNPSIAKSELIEIYDAAFGEADCGTATSSFTDARGPQRPRGPSGAKNTPPAARRAAA